MGNHNLEKLFYEYRAKYTLEKLFFTEYGELTHSDKPDLISSNGDGIEVTRAINPVRAKDDRFFNKNIRNNEDVGINTLKNFCKNSNIVVPFYDNGKFIGNSYAYNVWVSNDLIINTILNKISVINKNSYKKTNNLDLYIFSDSYKEYDEKDVFNILSDVKKDLNGIRFLYIDDCGWFYKCDLLNGEVSFFNTENVLHSICTKARNKAEKKDNG